ncbi:putative pectinesterase/pectinesterase inhibitor 58 [Carex rostrata]
MAKFMIISCATITAVTITILLTTPNSTANAAVTCDKVTSAFVQCMSYGGVDNGNPTVECCNGIRRLNLMEATYSTGAHQHHQSLCNCLKNLAKGTIVNATAAARLPGKCGIIFPYAIRSSTDCTSSMKPDVVVAKDGSGHYTKVNDAIAKMPVATHQNMNKLKFYVIYVKTGIYIETVRVPSGKDNLYIYGDGEEKTIITGNKSYAANYSTDMTPTFSVEANNFTATYMGFRNTAGPEKGQAVAFRINGEYGAFFRCSFDSFQDTLWVQNGTQFFRECNISGTVDFIMGDSMAVFQNCHIIVKPPFDTQNNVITAGARSALNDIAGLVIQNSRIMAAGNLNIMKQNTFLGRPWKHYSRVVYMESFLDGFIHPKGWKIDWNHSKISTLYYAEYDNRGPGSWTHDRVKSPGVHAIDIKQAHKFTPGHFIHVNRWIHPRKIPYYRGFAKTSI